MAEIRWREIPIIPMDAAEQLLETVLGAFSTSVKAGWDAWNSLADSSPDSYRALGARTRASFVYDQIVGQVKRRISNLDGVRLSERRGFLTVDVKGKALIRFKKLDQHGRSRGIPTFQRELFSCQLTLPGVADDRTRLIVGYQLDALQAQLQDVLVTCPNGSKVEWSFSIKDRDDGMIQFPKTSPSANDGDNSKADGKAASDDA